MYLVLTHSEANRLADRFKPDERKMTAVGVFCQQQTRERFATHGASGSAMWAHPKWRAQVGHDDGRAILTGPTGGLLNSFHVTATRNSASLGSGAKQAHIQQVGTVGKGGQLPDIVPRKAKALFIPLSDRAESSEVVQTASSMRRRSATTGPQGKPLIQGHFVNGKIEPVNADFIFLSVVKIPPRPMLPDSESERAAQGRFVVESLKS